MGEKLSYKQKVYQGTVVDSYQQAMTKLKIGSILISDFKLFLLKWLNSAKNDTCFLHRHVLCGINYSTVV